MELFYKLSEYEISLHNPKPARRIYIPKKNGYPLWISVLSEMVEISGFEPLTS